MLNSYEMLNIIFSTNCRHHSHAVNYAVYKGPCLHSTVRRHASLMGSVQLFFEMTKFLTCCILPVIFSKKSQQ